MKLIRKAFRGLSPEQIEEELYWEEIARSQPYSTHYHVFAQMKAMYGQSAAAIIMSKRRLKKARAKHTTKMTAAEYVAFAECYPDPIIGEFH